MHMGLGDRRSALKWQVKNQDTELNLCCASILAIKPMPRRKKDRKKIHPNANHSYIRVMGLEVKNALFSKMHIATFFLIQNAFSPFTGFIKLIRL